MSHGALGARLEICKNEPNHNQGEFVSQNEAQVVQTAQ
jgi:hypothetical protein